ncbi:MAG: low molecular weight protein-tyrosine-phosphatase [Arcobacteraceae bacterium]
MKKILFVCLGNICRSPLAHGIAENYVKENGLNTMIDSCGTGDFHIGEAPCKHSQTIADENGIDISKQTARQVTKEDFKKFDILVGLDDQNLVDLETMGCPTFKLKKLGLFGLDDVDIPDPYFFDGFEGFEKVYDMIEIATINLIDEVS